MLQSQAGSLLQQVRRMLHGQADGDFADAELLRRYTASSDEAAFAGLLRRHAGLVWGVCRRLLPREQDAEDAFQATFLVLAEKAGTICRAQAVGSWLYGVAHRIARRARWQERRRREHEARTASAPVPPADAAAALREQQAALEEEVARLPEKLCAPFVLCCLGGRSKAEAAAELGWKEGTVSGRLAEARQRLRARLARRGVSLAAALGTLDVGRGAYAAVCVAATAQGSGSVPARAVAWARGEVRAMQITAWRTGALVVLATTLLAVGAGLTAAPARPEADPGRLERQPQAVARPPDDGGPSDLYFPTKEGTRRVYEVRFGGKTSESSETVTKVDKKGAGFHVTTASEVAPGALLKTVTAVSAKGVYLVEVAGKVHAEPLPLLKLPAKAGDSWTVEHQIPAAGPAQFTSTVSKVEGVKVPAGTFQAIRVEEKTEQTNPPTTATRWYAPGVGLVKMVASSGTVEHSVVLKSFTPAGALDWKAFEDLKAFFLTDPFAKAIAELPAPERMAALKRLHDALKAKDVEILRRAALILGRLGDKGGVPVMIETLATAAGQDRDNVVVALRVLKDERAIPGLIKALKDPSPYVRSIAVAALGEVKATKAFGEIVALTKDKGDNTAGKNDGVLNCFPVLQANSACYALGVLGDLRAVPVLIELLTDRDLHQSALQALEALTQQKLGNSPEKWKAWWKAHGG
jgi:RNA polymerase sigma factor (sigma-70 family)